jgi:hypothetical protein
MKTMFLIRRIIYGYKSGPTVTGMGNYYKFSITKLKAFVYGREKLMMSYALDKVISLESINQSARLSVYMIEAVKKIQKWCLK